MAGVWSAGSHPPLPSSCGCLQAVLAGPQGPKTPQCLLETRPPVCPWAPSHSPAAATCPGPLLPPERGFVCILVCQQAAGGAPAVSSRGRSGTNGLRFHSGLSPLTQLDPFEASDPFSSSVSSKGPGEPHCHRVPTGHLGHPAAPTLGYPSSPARAVPGSSVAPQCLLSLGRHASAGALVLSLLWGLTGAGEHGQLSHPCQPRGDR